MSSTNVGTPSSSVSAASSTGIPFIKSKGRTVPKPFNLSTSAKSSASTNKKRDLSQVSSSDDGTCTVRSKHVEKDVKKLKMIPGSAVGSGVPFIKKKATTVCKPPVLSTDSRKNEKNSSSSLLQNKTKTQKGSTAIAPAKTPFEMEEEIVEKLIRELFTEVFKKDVNADPERIKVSTEALLKRLNTKIETELQSCYQFHTTSVDFALLKNFCRQHSRKFEIEMQSKLIKLKKSSVLKAVNSTTTKSNKAVLIASIKKLETETSTSPEKAVQEKLATQDENKMDEKADNNVNEPEKAEPLQEDSPMTTCSEVVEKIEEKPREEPVEDQADDANPLAPQATTTTPQEATEDAAQSVVTVEHN
ncbi:hypothetical protein C9374_004855 [Naegleria lovaniensis]|uniref:Uncharacterized protein n=1 Tax=Naegleria lovaniensis TaxID=51637 RepID=A0AA88GRN1_NAELO|nr:uncharacterized protein C9374_004855 [Naegleria lovaniensis]KAG2382888.1 hypothetical protein C9374_004855 [Naegleria lovaniensis]